MGAVAARCYGSSAGGATRGPEVSLPLGLYVPSTDEAARLYAWPTLGTVKARLFGAISAMIAERRYPPWGNEASASCLRSFDRDQSRDSGLGIGLQKQMGGSAPAHGAIERPMR